MPTIHHLWVANKGMTTPSGKPDWPTFLTLTLDERDAWSLHFSLSQALRERGVNPDTKGKPITVFVGGGELESS